MHDAHKHDLLTMTKRQTSFVVAGLLLALFMAFITGYFLGTKHATEEFITQMQQDMIANQLIASTCAPTSSSPASNQHITSEKTELPEPEKAKIAEIAVAVPAQEETHNKENNILYAAEIIGFPKKEKAQQFIDRIAKEMGITLELRTRHSKNQKGKSIAWYQVVTQRYTDEKELDVLINALKKKEHINKIDKVTCPLA